MARRLRRAFRPHPLCATGPARRDPSRAVSAGSPRSGGRVPRRVLLRAHHRRRDLRRATFPQPAGQGRPPRAVALLGQLAPCLGRQVALALERAPDLMAPPLVTRFAHDPGVVPAAGQHEGYVGVSQWVKLADRLPCRWRARSRPARRSEIQPPGVKRRGPPDPEGLFAFDPCMGSGAPAGAALGQPSGGPFISGTWTWCVSRSRRAPVIPGCHHPTGARLPAMAGRVEGSDGVAVHCTFMDPKTGPVAEVVEICERRSPAWSGSRRQAARSMG